MKRSRLRPISGKKAKQNRRIKAARENFRKEMGVCCICGKGHWERLTVHELWGGSHRQKTVEDRRFWLAACWPCHTEKLQHMPKDEQLAIKRLVDFEFYDPAIKEINRL